MKAITLRNLPPELSRYLEDEAAATDSSLNKTVIRLLLLATGLGERSRAKTRFHDLDDLAGTWTEEEARDFDACLAEQRRIDPEVWS